MTKLLKYQSREKAFWTLYGRNVEDINSTLQHDIDSGTKLALPKPEMIEEARIIELTFCQPVFNKSHTIEVIFPPELSVCVNANAYDSFLEQIENIHSAKRGNLVRFFTSDNMVRFIPQDLTDIIASHDWQQYRNKVDEWIESNYQLHRDIDEMVMDKYAHSFKN